MFHRPVLRLLILAFLGIVSSPVVAGPPEVHFGLAYDYDAKDIRGASDGRRLLVSTNGDLTVWDAETGREVRRYRTGFDRVEGIAWSPSGTVIAAAGNWDFVFLDSGTGQVLRRLAVPNQGRIDKIVFTPDLRRAITFSWLMSDLIVWDLEAGKEKCRLTGLPAGGSCLAVSPDGRWGLTGGQDGTIRVWDLEAGALERTIPRHQGAVTGIEVAPDGKKVLSWAQDNTARLWDLASGTLVGLVPNAQVQNTEASVTLARFSEDGQCLVTAYGTYPYPVKLWSLPDLKNLGTFQEPDHPYRAYALWARGSRFAFANSDCLVVGNWTQGTLRTAVGEKPSVSQERASLSPNGDRFLAAQMVWDTWSGRPYRTVPEAYQTVLVGDGSLLALGTPKEISLYDLKTDTVRARASADGFEAFSVSADGSRILAKTFGAPSLGLWEGPGLVLSQTFDNPGSGKLDGTLSADGRRVLTYVRETPGAVLWDADRKRPLRNLEDRLMESGGRWRLSADGQTALALSSYQQNRWDLATGKLRGGHNYYSTYGGTSSPDGQVLYLGLERGRVAAIGARDGNVLWNTRVSDGGVYGLLSDPAKNRLWIDSTDASVRVVDARDGRVLATLVRQKSGEWLTITPDGYFAGSPQALRSLPSFSDGIQARPLTEAELAQWHRPDLVAARFAGEELSKLIGPDNEETARRFYAEALAQRTLGQHHRAAILLDLAEELLGGPRLRTTTLSILERYQSSDYSAPELLAKIAIWDRLAAKKDPSRPEIEAIRARLPKS